jgi:uncharacterized membrane protein YgcG
MKKLKWILLCILLAFFFDLPVHADNTEYVIDDDALLSTSEVAQLNKAAEEVSKKYNVGVYIRIEKVLPDMPA